MSRSYEMMYILRPDLSEEQVKGQVNKYRDFLKEHQAENINIKIWGKKRLAYPIQKFLDGIYVLMNYQADGQQIAPLERAMRLSEEVIRYLTIQITEDVATIEELEEEEEVKTETAPHSEGSNEVTPRVEPKKPVEIKPEVATEPVPETDMVND